MRVTVLRGRQTVHGGEAVSVGLDYESNCIYILTSQLNDVVVESEQWTCLHIDREPEPALSRPLRRAHLALPQIDQRHLVPVEPVGRDERVFPDPFRFDVRRPNADRHLAFGIGVHFCLGAHLARMELQAFFRELLPRLEHVELAGEPQSMATTFVGGPKRLPIRYRLRAAR